MRGAQPLRWQDVVRVAAGAPLALDPVACAQLDHGAALAAAVAASGQRAYGISTGVGALCDTVVAQHQQSALSHNILRSHAVGVGAPLEPACVRAMLCAAVNNFALGRSGVRREVVERLLAMLRTGALPFVPAGGSLGYLTHMAHACLPLIGERAGATEGHPEDASHATKPLPLTLLAKEGLSLVNGTPCATGFGALAVARAQRLFDWADVAAAMSCENLGAQEAAFAAEALALRVSPGVQTVGRRLRRLLSGSQRLADARGQRTQDALSLRAVPQVHGAARDRLDQTALCVDRELASATDNPLLAGTVEAPRVLAQAHAVGAALGLAMDALAIAVAEVAAMAERRIDRLLNPALSGLPAFLAQGNGLCSGFMIAQYTAASLVAANRRLAAPASLDGGVTSALQEDHLAHATPAALKALDVVANAEYIVAIELLAAAQAYALGAAQPPPAPALGSLLDRLRSVVPPYADDRPLANDITMALAWLRQAPLAEPSKLLTMDGADP